MTNSKKPPFGLQRDGSIDRRDFLRTAGRLGVGAFGLSSLGLASARQRGRSVQHRLGTADHGPARLVLLLPLYRRPDRDRGDQRRGRHHGPADRAHRGGRRSLARQGAGDRQEAAGSGLNFIAGPTGSSQSLSSLATTTPAKIIQATYANGAEMGDASIAPSAAPAPTTVCSSSMNSRMRPSADLISPSTALRRSSNSPRYFAPATSDPCRGRRRSCRAGPRARRAARCAGRAPRRSRSCRRRARRSARGCSWSCARGSGSCDGSPRRGR